ncbi:MAG: hypothetical protein AVDCRST_MAG88-1517 [uncultured Thermomicrobiales bacterium]|uniref:Uncharacterized protein n=1 Tax=uncultured Thermomicrobiales bacterium TaxID=1645740 RepID=A0A6J4UXK1_9BACT|nr:MAG: hypothetical protein AVDCRST_MAG88-1517 [uncultured Thermomicrobiales bacterium]
MAFAGANGGPARFVLWLSKTFLETREDETREDGRADSRPGFERSHSE